MGLPRPANAIANYARVSHGFRAPFPRSLNGVRFHRCSERPLEQAGINLARVMHVMGICVMLGTACRFSLSNTSRAIGTISRSPSASIG